MSVVESMVLANDGLALFERCWSPPADPAAVVIGIHGYAEHCGRYRDFAEFLNGHDIAFHTFDLRGHGRSKGRRAYIQDFSILLYDLDIVVRLAQEQNPDIPLFLFGHSMGGTIAALYGITRPVRFNGVILSAPALKTPDDVSVLRINLAKAVTFFFPTTPVQQPISPEKLSHDPDAVQRYIDDPLVYHGPWQARTATELITAIWNVQKRAEGFKHPLLILHGGKDDVVEAGGGRLFYDKAGSSDKSMKIYDDAFHELLNETEKKTVMNDILQWIQSHLPAS